VTDSPTAQALQIAIIADRIDPRATSVITKSSSRVSSVQAIGNRSEALHFLQSKDSKGVNCVFFGARSGHSEADPFFVDALICLGFAHTAIVTIGGKFESLHESLQPFEFLASPIKEEAVAILLDRLVSRPRYLPNPDSLMEFPDPDPDPDRTVPDYLFLTRAAIRGRWKWVSNSPRTKLILSWHNFAYAEGFSRGTLVHLVNGSIIPLGLDIDTVAAHINPLVPLRADRFILNAYNIADIVHVDATQGHPVAVKMNDADQTVLYPEYPVSIINVRDIYTGQMVTKGSAFICHASDDKENIRPLYAQLTSDDVKCWIDDQDLRPGENWDFEIDRVMRECHYVIVCLSAASVNKSGYVQKELKKALDLADEQPEGSIFLVPVRLEECEVPRRLRHLHYVDLFRDDGYARLLAVLRSNPRRRG
jgi:hypothetical protein